MQGVAKSSNDDISLHKLMRPERYGANDPYRAEKAEFHNLVRGLVPADWKLGSAPGVWITALAPGHLLPTIGFRIHISILQEQAGELLATVVPILVEERIDFKVLVDERAPDSSNSHRWGSGGTGKFITAYPMDSDEFKRVIERLHQATKHFCGPYLVSDKRYKDNKVLFYRHSAMKKHQAFSIYGELLALLGAAPRSRPECLAEPEPKPDDKKSDPLPKLKSRPAAGEPPSR